MNDASSSKCFKVQYLIIQYFLNSNKHEKWKMIPILQKSLWSFAAWAKYEMLISNKNHDWMRTILPYWLLLVSKFRSTYMRPGIHGIRQWSYQIKTCAGQVLTGIIDQGWFDQRWSPFCLCKVAISDRIWYIYNHVALKIAYFFFIKLHKYCFDLELWIISNCHSYDDDVTVLLWTIPYIFIVHMRSTRGAC